MKTAKKFQASGWFTHCPYCDELVDMDCNPADEGEIVDCPHCKKQFKSGGWSV